jgi:hypothetical protein
MAKQPSTAKKKSVSEANLAALGAERLAGLLMEAASADPALKRLLRMELAAEIGAADLAFEIDKRLTALASSRARVSWRKRPGLLAELQALRRMIVERLVPLDSRLGLDRLVAWFDLYPSLTARVSDAKGELPLLFDAASSDLAGAASAAGPDIAGPVLGEALSTRLGQWAAWVGRGSHALDPAVATRLLRDLAHGRPKPTGRLALVVRRLADRAGDLDAWLHSISDEDLRKPEVGAEAAGRLAEGGRTEEARALLEASRAPAPTPSRWRKGMGAEPDRPADAWLQAEIAVLDAEGRGGEADEARWAMFERSLDADALRVLLARLPDFEDVVALDRAFDLAARHPDVMKGLTFLMAWPAPREAADLVVARAAEVRGGHDDIPLWASRLAGRHPLAALLLVRARAAALMRRGGGMSEEIEGLVGEAETLATQANGEVESHEAFVAALRSQASPPRRRW